MLVPQFRWAGPGCLLANSGYASTLDREDEAGVNGRGSGIRKTLSSMEVADLGGAKTGVGTTHLLLLRPEEGMSIKFCAGVWVGVPGA